MKKAWIFISLICAITAVLLFIFIKGKLSTIKVEKVEILNTEVEKTVSASGVVASISEADLSFPVSGKIQKLNVVKGQEVKTGDALAYLDNYSTYQDSLADKDALDVTIRDKELYIENYETNPDAVGGRDEYNIGVRRLDELISKAKDTYQSSLGDLSKTYLKAPFDGTVVDIIKKEGEVETLGSTVIKLADLNNLIFEANLDQEDFGSIKLGQQVSITLDSYNGQSFNGYVYELPKYVNSDKQDFKIKIKIDDNANKPILLGMKGDVSILIKKTDGKVTAVTFDSILADSKGHYLWVSANGAAHKEYIETGLEGDIYTEIKTDLSGLVVIVPKSGSTLKDGSRISYE